MNERDDMVAQLRGWDHCWPARWLETAVADAADQIERDGREIERLEAENERMREALTPSGETKYAYSGEFLCWAADENGIEQGYERMVPWTTIKEIMAAIRSRAALTKGDSK